MTSFRVEKNGAVLVLLFKAAKPQVPISGLKHIK